MFSYFYYIIGIRVQCAISIAYPKAIIVSLLKRRDYCVILQKVAAPTAFTFLSVVVFISRCLVLFLLCCNILHYLNFQETYIIRCLVVSLFFSLFLKRFYSIVLDFYLIFFSELFIFLKHIFYFYITSKLLYI